jgi:hypothetical protein
MTKTERLIQDLQRRSFSASDMRAMASVDSDEIIKYASQHYPVRCFERSIGDLREVGLAESHSSRRMPRRAAVRKSAASHTYLHCLFLSSERGKITGITYVSRIQFRPTSPSGSSWEMSSGEQLDIVYAADEWIMRLRPSISSAISATTLAKRGWGFSTGTPARRKPARSSGKRPRPVAS